MLRRAFAPALTLALAVSGAAATASVATAAPPAVVQAPTGPQGAAAVGSFLLYMLPTGDPDGTGALCTGIGLNTSDDPYVAGNDCGFLQMSASGVTGALVATFEGEDGTVFLTDDADEDAQTAGDYQVTVDPDDTWPAGAITVRFSDGGGAAAGTYRFFHNALVADVEAGDPTAPGEAFDVTGSIVGHDGAGADAGDLEADGATFSVRVSTADGTELWTSDEQTADGTGGFSTTVPDTVTAGLAPGAAENFQTQLSVDVVDATWEDGTVVGGTGTWGAADAGSDSHLVQGDAPAAEAITVENSFVSSVGWVKPGDEYPSRVVVTNVGDAASDVTVAIPAPDGANYTEARAPQGTNASVVDGSITWTIPTLAAGTPDAPTTVAMVMLSEADTLAEDEKVVWKNLSTTATLTARTVEDTSTTHGPKVIPPNETYESARYGDRPFPVIPVAYRDRAPYPTSSGEALAEKINSPDVVGSTFNLFQEMSLGQLFPDGTVPSAGIASADFDYDDGFPFTSLEPAGTCSGTTVADSPLPVQGTPLYPERITDGFYNLPGDTGYYGSDPYGSAIVGSATGLLFDIDSGCGPTGKLVLDAAAVADPEIDYNDYDTDKDGVVDFFMVVYTGCGGNGASQLGVCTDNTSDTLPYDNVWPHSSSLEFYYNDPVTGLPGFATDDQLKNLEGQSLFWVDDSYSQQTTDDTGLPVYVRVGPYNVNPETAIEKASVISHEYGHSLGLPDFYSLGGSRETYGDWTLMATDKSQNIDAYGRQELGWVVPTVLQAGQTVVEGMTDSKEDTNSITWQTPDGTPYTLTGDDVHNSEMYVAKLPGRQLLSGDIFANGGSATHAWWSGSGNDFACPNNAKTRSLDIAIPGIEDLPAGSTVDLTFDSYFDIEWNYDYGFVMTTTDGGQTYTSHASEAGTTTDSNPNGVGCLTTYGNGIHGSSGSYAAGSEQLDALTDTYPDPEWIEDSFDISDLVGADAPALRLAYVTDGGLARPGWFMDDITVTATTPSGEQVLLQTDLESGGGPEDPRFFPGGCKEGLSIASVCGVGWKYVDGDAVDAADHAYYMEMRDRSGFDLDSHDENDRADIDFGAGFYVGYTDENHGYGNVGTDNEPAQSPLDSQPVQGDEAPNLADAAWTAAVGDNTFSDASADPWIDNYDDGSGAWTFDYDCLSFEVTSMSGEGNGPATSDGDLTGDVTFDLAGKCGEFDYGYSDVEVPDNTAPSAAATATPDTVAVGEQVALDGSGSSDAETPDDLSYSWDFADGGATKDATTETTTVTYDEPGVYDVRLTVTDPLGESDQATVRVVVEGATGAPVAGLTASPTIAATGETVSFDASSTVDSDTPAEDLTFNWAFGDGDTLADAGPMVDHAYAAAGSYDAVVQVLDPEGNGDVATVTITVTANEAPEAAITADPVVAGVGQAVSFDASGTTDDSTAIDDLVFDYDFGDGSSVPDAGPTVSHAFTTAGQKTITVTVTDADGASDTADVAITVQSAPGNTAPTAAVTADPTTVEAGNPVAFDASGSTDAETPDDLTYTWAFGDGGQGAGETTSHTYTDAGTYQAVVTVTDPGGLTDSAAVEITVTGGGTGGGDNTAPTAAVTADPTSTTVGRVVQLDATGSTDAETPNGLTYDWDYGDGETAVDAGATPRHSWVETGTFTVTVTVTDPDGLSDTATVDVVVDEATNTPPTAELSATPATVDAGEDVTFDASASTDAETPDDLVYDWNFGDGTTMRDAGPVVTHAYTRTGERTAYVLVTDTDGQSDVAAATVTVNAVGTAPTAVLKVVPKVAVTGQTITLSAGASRDEETPRGQLTYRWAFGPGAKVVDGEGARTSVRYLRPGTRTITVAVIDEDGMRSQAEVKVRVDQYVACPSRTVKRAGRWETARSNGAEGGTYCASVGPKKHVVRVAFTGPSVRLDLGRAKDGGQAVVKVDGQRVRKLSFRGGSKRVRFGTTKTVKGLGGGKHVLTVVVPKGQGRAYLDGFVVRSLR